MHIGRHLPLSDEQMLPDIPRTNSKLSGLRFCGIKLLPVEKASAIFMKSNSLVA